MRKKGRHILLFLDNAPSHPPVKLNNIKLVFLPANTTSLSQPMDQGIIQILKLKYRRRQLQYILTQMERTDKVGSTMLRKNSILDAIYRINGAWKEIETSTIQMCFAKCGLSDDVFDVNAQSVECSDDENDDIPLAVLRMSLDLFRCEFQELVNIDKNVAVCDTNTTDWNAPTSEVLNELKSCVRQDDDAH